MLSYKDQDIINFTESYLIHQCNCVTNVSKGLAETIFKLYPDANKYIDSNFKRIPGTISVHDKIINMYAQRYPGKSKYNNDTKSQRLEWFKMGLNSLKDLPNIKSIAVPFKIGCGLAGGDWNEYFKELEIFVEKSGINVVIYKI